MQLTMLFSISCEFDRGGGEATLVDVLKLVLFVVVNPVNATDSVQILSHILPLHKAAFLVQVKQLKVRN